MTSTSRAARASFVAVCFVLAPGCSESTTRDTDTGGGTDGGARDVGAGADVGPDASSVDAAVDARGTDAGPGTGDGGTDAAGPDGGGRVPVNHRPDDSECRAVAPAGMCSFGGGFDCSMDSDCTAGVNGRCNMNLGGAAFCRCTYDTCSGDVDCPSAQTCACHGATFHADSNECVAGDCRVDSDCGAGGFCSPTIGGCGGLQGYYCHTAGDLCTDDADCTSGGGLDACEHVTASARWECVPRMFCP